MKSEEKGRGSRIALVRIILLVNAFFAEAGVLAIFTGMQDITKNR